MRKKSSMQNNGYNQHRKPRYQGGGGDHRRDHHHSGNRPRKNYSASREKYLAQARDALASGDRVLAENYLQHADHCYRMMMEEGFRPRPAQPQQGQGQEESGQPQGNTQEVQEAMPTGNTSALPAFITNYDSGEQKPQQQVPVQNWEERDEA